MWTKCPHWHQLKCSPNISGGGPPDRPNTLWLLQIFHLDATHIASPLPRSDFLDQPLQSPILLGYDLQIIFCVKIMCLAEQNLTQLSCQSFGQTLDMQCTIYSHYIQYIHRILVKWTPRIEQTGFGVDKCNEIYSRDLWNISFDFFSSYAVILNL